MVECFGNVLDNLFLMLFKNILFWDKASVAQAGLQFALYLRMTLNFWSCEYWAVAASHQTWLMPGLGWHPRLCVRHTTLCQLSYIPSPEVVPDGPSRCLLLSATPGLFWFCQSYVAIIGHDWSMISVLPESSQPRGFRVGLPWGCPCAHLIPQVPWGTGKRICTRGSFCLEAFSPCLWVGLGRAEEHPSSSSGKLVDGLCYLVD